MSTNTVPNERDLPSGRLAARKRALLAELLRERGPSRGRLVALAVGTACAVAAATALGVALTGGRTTTTATSAYVLVSLQRASDDEGRPTNTFCLDASAPCAFFIVPYAGPDFISGRPERFSETTKITGGSAEQRALLSSIVAATRPNSIARIEIESSPRRVMLRPRAFDSSDLTRWQELLIAAAFRDHALNAGADLEIGTPFEGGSIGGGPATLPAAKPGTAAAARRTFEDAADSIDATVADLRIYKPYGVAVDITMRTEGPAQFLADRMPLFLAAIGDPWEDYDGVSILLVDQAGVPVWRFSTAARTGTGMLGVIGTLVDCSPIEPTLMLGESPPPCPVS